MHMWLCCTRHAPLMLHTTRTTVHAYVVMVHATRTTYGARDTHDLCRATLNNHNTCTAMHTASDAQHNVCTRKRMWLRCTNTCTTHAQCMTYNFCIAYAQQPSHVPYERVMSHMNHKHLHNTCTMYDIQLLHSVCTTTESCPI